MNVIGLLFLMISSVINGTWVSIILLLMSIPTHMRLAIKGDSRTTGLNDNFNLIAEDVNAHSIVSIKTSPPVKAGGIRSQMNLFVHPNSVTPLKEWCKDLDTENIDYVAVFNNSFISITNNYKLIQFQYKLLIRISASRYIRLKMSIVRDNPICCNCKLHLESLTHIFLNCPHTKSFISLLRSFILLKIDPTYRDQLS